MVIVKINSSTGKGTYDVDTIALTCTCPHYTMRMIRIGGICKHIQQALNDLNIGTKEEDYLEFIKANKDAVEFVEKYSEGTLTMLKQKGSVIEVNGKLILI
jgi:hypothetical protein